MAFQQAQIPVKKTEEFEQLKSAIERAFAAQNVEMLLNRFQGSGVRVREFEKALDKRVFESVDPALSRGAQAAKDLYGKLELSDRALIREFYLERVEKVDPALRGKFQKIYRYY